MATGLFIDYSIRPSVVPVVETGQQVSLMRAGIIEHPTRSDIVEIPISKIERRSMVQPCEIEISGYEYLERLEGNHETLLDVRVMEEFLKNPSMIPVAYRRGVTCFFGTRFVDKYGDNFVAGFVWNGRWFVHYHYCLRLPFTHQRFAVSIPASFS